MNHWNICGVHRHPANNYERKYASARAQNSTIETIQAGKVVREKENEWTNEWMGIRYPKLLHNFVCLCKWIVRTKQLLMATFLSSSSSISFVLQSLAAVACCLFSSFCSVFGVRALSNLIKSSPILVHTAHIYVAVVIVCCNQNPLILYDSHTKRNKNLSIYLINLFGWSTLLCVLCVLMLSFFALLTCLPVAFSIMAKMKNEEKKKA